MYEHTIETTSNPTSLGYNGNFNFCLSTGSRSRSGLSHRGNYVRAESDFQMKGYIENFNCFGKFHYGRKPYDVDNQVTVRGNRDTLYSFGVFDLTSPLSITLPDSKGRYQSLMIVSQDHSISVVYGPEKVTLTRESVGTRYVFLTIRTFVDAVRRKASKYCDREVT